MNPTNKDLIHDTGAAPAINPLQTEEGPITATSESMGARPTPVSRREALGMLGVGAGAAVFASALPSWAGGLRGNSLSGLARPRPFEPFGLQMYTLRGKLQQDLEGTFARVAQIGYRTVQCSPIKGIGNFYGLAPVDFKQMLDKQGLACYSLHFNYTTEASSDSPAIRGDLFTNREAFLDGALSIGIKDVIMPWLPESARRTESDWQALAGHLNQFNVLAQQRGMTLHYHNHDFEFRPVQQGGVSGPIPYQILLDELDNTVMLEPDIYWMIRGGQDPVAWFDKAPGRFPLWHLKDAHRQDGSTERFGHGTIDWPRLWQASKKAGYRRGYIEQDNCKGDAFDCVTGSYQAMTLVASRKKVPTSN